MKERPEREAFPKDLQKRIIKKAKEYVLSDLIPNHKINKILLFGSLAKGEFGKYKGSFRGRIFSDINILIFAEDDFSVPKQWRINYRGAIYNVYNIGKLDGFLIQYTVCTRSSYENEENQKEAEEWGIPISYKKSKNKYIVFYYSLWISFKLVYQ